MNLQTKIILKSLFPPCLYAIKAILSGWYNNYKFKNIKWVTSLKEITKDQRLFIIGNGPSLKRTMELYHNFLEKEQCAVVNFFGNTDLFLSIKPQWYILADPAFFKERSTLNPRVQQQLQDLYNVFDNKLNWNINFCIPTAAVHSELVAHLSSKKNINIYYFNYVGNYEHILNKSLKFKLWDKNILAPLMQTVLNTAVQLGIMMRFKEIYLLGADTSWHTTYDLDQNTNTLYTIDTHFYGNKRYPVYMDSECTQPSHLHNELLMASKALESYWLLNEYANYANIKVYNASEMSWIDAFERKKISQIINHQ